MSLLAGTFTEESFRRALAAAERLAADANARNAAATWISIVGPRAEPPNASMRKRAADSLRSFGTLRMAMVTTSVLHRAALVALHWLNPPRPGQLFLPCATFDEARAWVEAQAGAPLPVLAHLRDRVRREADRGPPSRWPSPMK
ncbi:MAG TPA: hypothetical protein VFS00_05720 [Polyangiaceae bacterium]|nr:hypothetical protein [Polyangiaceae bacterium]